MQELPEPFRRKRKLIVRDWFYYVVWYVRLRKLMRNFYSEQLLKSKLEIDKKRFKEMIKASQGGIQAVKEFLAKEQTEREKAVREKDKVMDGFKPNVYQYARLTLKFDQFTVQIHETDDQSNKKPPLYDLTSRQVSYESTLTLGQRKLRNRIGMRYFALKQLYVMDGDL